MKMHIGTAKIKLSRLSTELGQQLKTTPLRELHDAILDEIGDELDEAQGTAIFWGPSFEMSLKGRKEKILEVDIYGQVDMY